MPPKHASDPGHSANSTLGEDSTGGIPDKLRSKDNECVKDGAGLRF